jgi:hypothetical protein
MMENKDMERYKEFKSNLNYIFRGVQGKQVLDFLRECYVETSALDSSKEMTFYKLGQKELIQSIIREATSEEVELEVKY